MILQALTAYYEALRARGEIGEIGWAETRVQYALELDAAGQLLRSSALGVCGRKGKAIVRHLELPAPVKRTSGVNANFLWDNSACCSSSTPRGSRNARNSALPRRKSCI